MKLPCRPLVLSLCALLLPLVTACETPIQVESACGDGYLDPGEACDGANVPVANCEQLGYYSGTGPVTCTADCQLDLSTCGARCGDGLVQVAYGEECDGEELGGQTCVSAGMGSGTLACTTGCRLDVSGCSEAAVCGDGLVAAPSEACDLSDLQGATCQTLGWYGGELACDGDCRYDLAGCRPFGRCGDGVIQGDYGEACDGFALGGVTCQSLAWYGGQLACASDCTLDLTACEAAGRCGDGRLQDGAGELCDGAELGALTCAALFPGYGEGTLACDADCAPDPSGCARCGDGVVQAGAGELCDGAETGGATCESLGFYAGALACATDCGSLDPSACGGWCGDGTLQAGFGDNTIISRSTPVAVMTASATQLSGAARVIAGYVFSCTVQTNGDMTCWGRNNYGQLGDGTNLDHLTPGFVH